MEEHNLKIIVNLLEDEKIIIDHIVEIFKQDELYKLTCYTEAIPFVMDFNMDVDLIITDIKINGYDAIETLKEFSKKNPSCYFIVISGYLDRYYEALINEVNVDKVVAKTSSPDWINLVYQRAEELKPKILGKPKFIKSHETNTIL